MGYVPDHDERSLRALESIAASLERMSTPRIESSWDNLMARRDAEQAVELQHAHMARESSWISNVPTVKIGNRDATEEEIALLQGGPTLTEAQLLENDADIKAATSGDHPLIQAEAAEAGPTVWAGDTVDWEATAMLAWKEIERLTTERNSILRAAHIEFPGGDTDADFMTNAAWRLEHNYEAGGSGVRNAVARVLRAVAAALEAEWEAKR